MSEQAERFYSEMYSVQDSRISWGEYIGRLYDTDEIELLTEHEIVRCKDCVWAKPDQSDHEFRELRCNMWIADVSADGFCSRGKRKQ